jgi:hypothetical protein
MFDRLLGLRRFAAVVLLGALLAGGVVARSSLAAEEEVTPGPEPAYSGEHCAVTCGRFKEDTCEVWDPAGEPSCSCSVGGIGAYTQCRCADGSTPTRCTCSSAPHASCNPDNPQDECGSCRCQC